MTEPLPEPQGERQRIPPTKKTAVGLLEPDAPGAFPWRLVLIIVALLLLVTGALYLGLR